MTAISTLLLAVGTMAGISAAAVYDTPATQAVAATPPASDPLAGFDRLMADMLRSYDQPGIAIAVVKDDKVVLLQGYGVSDFASKQPVTPDTQFVIASATKQFVSFGVGLLVDEDKLSFDKPVRNYIPDFELKDPLATQLVSLRDMLSHRTGLPRHDLLWYGNDTFTRADMIKRLRDLDMSATPRETWQYNNLMYMSAGYAIQQATGQTWEDFTRARIFTPLGMSRSNFSVRDVEKSSDHATPYERKDSKPVAIPFRNVDTLGPAGSMNSTIRDLVPWLRVHLNDGKLGDKTIISSAILQQLHAPQMVIGPGNPQDELSPNSYAMGFFTESYRGHWRVQHGGNLDGFTSRITLFPKEKLGIVVLANMNASALPELLTRTLSDRYLDLASRDWIAEGAARLQAEETSTAQAKTRKAELQIKGTAPSHPLTAYAGIFTHPAYGELTIQVAGQGLEGRYNTFRFRLIHKHYDTFVGEVDGTDETFKDLPLTYRTDADGRISSVLLALESSVAPIEFVRKASARNADPTILASYAGIYLFQGREYVVSVSGDRLLLSSPGQSPSRMDPDSEDGYFSIGGTRLRFKTADGKVVALEQLAADGVYTLTRKP